MPEISKAYEPQSVEARWYQFWLDNNLFTANPESPKPAYSIVIPPPNVTGVLTLGHVLNNTIQDILARKARMDGQEVLWLPGTDHASIATHSVLERKLKKEEGITRYDLGREKFIERAQRGVFQVAQPPGQHHVADAGDGGPDVGKAVRPGEQRPQDRAGPAGTEELDRRVESHADWMNLTHASPNKG